MIKSFFSRALGRPVTAEEIQADNDKVRREIAQSRRNALNARSIERKLAQAMQRQSRLPVMQSNEIDCEWAMDELSRLRNRCVSYMLRRLAAIGIAGDGVEAVIKSEINIMFGRVRDNIVYRDYVRGG